MDSYPHFRNTCKEFPVSFYAQWKEHREKIFGSMSKTELLPLFLMNHDSTFDGVSHGFPKTSLLPGRILRELYGRKHAEWWKFSTVGFDGKKRKVKYLGGFQ